VNKPESRSDLTELRDLVREFVSERDWDKFHTPKNLATALSVEASELLEPFQWLVSGDKHEIDEAKLTAIRHEMADVLVYLVRLADKMEVDLFQAVLEKMALNRAKYPADQVRGDSRKYSEYKDKNQ
jgi:NTP pyrophosphatase (non-canonical NTP hydrolase)